MAGRVRTGGSSLLAAFKELMRLYKKYGAAPLVARLGNPGNGMPVLLAEQLAILQAWEAADNYPGEIEIGPPSGPEDP